MSRGQAPRDRAHFPRMRVRGRRRMLRRFARRLGVVSVMTIDMTGWRTESEHRVSAVRCDRCGCLDIRRLAAGEDRAVVVGRQRVELAVLGWEVGVPGDLCLACVEEGWE